MRILFLVLALFIFGISVGVILSVTVIKNEIQNTNGLNIAAITLVRVK